MPRGRNKKRSSKHAGSRVVLRGAGGLSLYELEKKVRQGRARYIQHQSTSRTLCVLQAPEGPVYLVINRRTKEIVTILSEKMAMERLRADAKECSEGT